LGWSFHSTLVTEQKKKPSLLKHLEGCWLGVNQGLLNQAIIAQEDVEGYFVIRRVSFIIAAAVGHQRAARRV
jgi:hypothetical protein